MANDIRRIHEMIRGGDLGPDTLNKLAELAANEHGSEESDSGSEVNRPDWEENDPESKNYIANRVGGYTYTNTFEMSGIAKKDNDGYFYIDIVLPEWIMDNDVFYPTLFDITYNKVNYGSPLYHAFSRTGENPLSYRAIGNRKLFKNPEGGEVSQPESQDEIPYAFLSSDSISFTRMYVTEPGTHFIKIQKTCTAPISVGTIASGLKDGETLGYAATAEGQSNISSAYVSHAEGDGTTSSGECSHSEGKDTTASGSSSHAEGEDTTASANASHAEGGDSTASGNLSHAEGYSTTASGNISHAEGYGTTSSGAYSHAEGWGGTDLTLPDNTTVKGGTAASIGTHVEGKDCYASIFNGPPGAHAEGFQTMAIGGGANHAEGYTTKATAQAAHAEGMSTTASGNVSHAEGRGTIAAGLGQHAGGEYNIADTPSSAQVRGTYVEIIGNGTGASERSNARTLDWSGNEWLAGTLKLGGTSASDNTAVDVLAAINALTAAINTLNGDASTEGSVAYMIAQALQT